VSTAAAALPPDAELVLGLRGGVQSTFTLLLDAWSPGMLRTARAYVASTEAAEDVVQETWLAVIRGIDGFAGRSSLRTWVYRILVNIAKTHGVKDSRTLAWSALTGDDDAGSTVDPSRFQGPDEPYPGHWRRFPDAWPSPESEVMWRAARGMIDSLRHGKSAAPIGSNALSGPRAAHGGAQCPQRPRTINPARDGNQATIWHAQHLAGVHAVKEDCGILMRTPWRVGQKEEKGSSKVWKTGGRARA